MSRIVVTGLVGLLLLVLVAILGIAILGGRASAPGPQGAGAAPAVEPAAGAPRRSSPPAGSGADTGGAPRP